MMESAAWRPLLEGSLANRAWDVIWRIAEDLRNFDLPEHASFSGPAGPAIFFAQLAEATENDDLADFALDCLDRSLETVFRHSAGLSLYGGFIGPAWLLEYLRGRLLEDTSEGHESADDLCCILREHLQDRTPKVGDQYDLISGLVGLGVYTLEAIHRPTAVDCAEILLEHLERIADDSNGTARWFTPPEMLPDHQLADAPNGYWNLGLAHGSPGVVAILARFHAAGLGGPQVPALARRAVHWILNQQLPKDGHSSCIPTWVTEPPTLAARRPNPAWCYGDLGVAAALMLAGHHLHEERWRAEALAIAKYSALTGATTPWYSDWGLCHGTAGVAHILNRIYQATHDPELGAAATFWFEETLEQHNPEIGCGGFLTIAPSPDDPSKRQWEEDPSFLTGSSGIGLALLGAVTTIPPDWDRLLLTDIPPRAT